MLQLDGFSRSYSNFLGEHLIDTKKLRSRDLLTRVVVMGNDDRPFLCEASATIYTQPRASFYQPGALTSNILTTSLTSFLFPFPPSVVPS